MTEKRDNPYTVPRAGLETPFSAGSEIELASIGQRIGALHRLWSVVVLFLYRICSNFCGYAYFNAEHT